MAGRPRTYTQDDERPVTVSVRVPKVLYAQAQQYASQRRMSMTELLLDGLTMRLETPTDPREVFLSDESNTVIQELRDELKGSLLDELRKDVQKLLTSTGQAGLTQSPQTPLPTHNMPLAKHDVHPTQNDILSDNGNTVLQKAPHSVAPHIAAIAQVAAEHPTLTLAQLAHLLYERGIYRAKDRATGAETVVNRGTLKVWLDKARAAGLL